MTCASVSNQERKMVSTRVFLLLRRLSYYRTIDWTGVDVVDCSWSWLIRLFVHLILLLDLI